MGLQVYYMLISIYGWWSWQSGGQSNSSGEKLQISSTNKALWIILFGINLLVTLLMYFILGKYTDSPIPFGDAFTTSLSIIATWMLARKKIEQWLIWILIDIVSIGLYLYRGLYPTIFLFFVYTIMAVIGYFEWRRDLRKL